MFPYLIGPYIVEKTVKWVLAQRDGSARAPEPDGEETWIVDRLADWSEAHVEEYVDRKVLQAAAGTTLRSRVQFTHSCTQSVTVRVDGRLGVSAKVEAGIARLVDGEVRTALSLSAGRTTGRDEVYTASETVDVEILPGHAVVVEAVWHRRIRRGTATVFGTLSGRRASGPFEATIGLALESVTTEPLPVP